MGQRRQILGLLKEHPKCELFKGAQALHWLLYWELSNVNGTTRPAGAFLCGPEQLVLLSKAAVLLVKLL